MAKVFNVDEYLKENEVTVKINGKDFIVKDVPFGIQDKLKDTDEASQKAFLCELLQCKMDDLEGYGIAAISGIIHYITENLFPEPSRKTQ